MPSVINTNIASLNAQRNLGVSQSALATSLQRLSSGLRINSAKDDAAGLAISDRMTSQVRGLNQAARNANDGISLAQTAEGALAEIGNNLQRIRELAMQSANATNSASDRASLQAEASQLTAEITRVASQTSFNGLNLLDGSFTAQDFQVGANANQTISVSSISDARATALGSNILSAVGTVTGKTLVAATAYSAGNATLAEADLTLTTDKGTTSAIAYGVKTGADTIAAAINTAASGIGITATASSSATLDTLSVAGTVTFNLRGGDVAAAHTAAISAVITDKNDLTNLVAAINGAQGSTGVTATFTTASSKASITLSTTDGRNIAIGTFDNTGGGAGDTVNFGGSALTDGAAATANAVVTGTISLASSQGRISTANAGADIFAAAGANYSSFVSVAALDLSTAAGAQAAIGGVDAALAQINSSRGSLGAYQNRFTSAIANLQTTSENVTAARSRIQDTDFAAETAQLTRNQILQQAGTAMLAQANQLPQLVLSLLK